MLICQKNVTILAKLRNNSVTTPELVRLKTVLYLCGRYFMFNLLIF